MIAGWLFLIVMVTLLKTAFMDPGIIPRASIDESNYIEKTIGNLFALIKGLNQACFVIKFFL